MHLRPNAPASTVLTLYIPPIFTVFHRTDTLDLSGTLNDAAAALVDDSFLRCFKSAVDDPWNWNFYLFPLWCCGVVVRNLILFPIRVLVLILGFLLFVLGFALAAFLPVRIQIETETTTENRFTQIHSSRTSLKLEYYFCSVFQPLFLSLFQLYFSILLDVFTLPSNAIFPTNLFIFTFFARRSLEEDTPKER